MQSVEKGLDLTDRFLQAFIQVDSRLDDPSYIKCLRNLRQQHKKAMSVTENWVMPAAAAASDANYTTANNACCYCKDLIKDATETEASVYQNCGSWQQKRTVQYTEEWVPTEDSAGFSTVDHCDHPSPVEHSPKLVAVLAANTQETASDFDDNYRNDSNQKAEEKLQPSIKLQHNSDSLQHNNENDIQIHPENLEEVDKNKAAVELEREKNSTSGNEYCNSHLRRCISAEASEWNKEKNFKANAIPLTVYIPTLKSKLNAEIRARSRSERAINLINNSHLPYNMQDHMIRSRMQHNLRHSKICTNTSPPTYQPIMPKKVPNFSAIHKRLLEAMENGKVRRCTTVEPFHFDTESRAQLRHHCVEQPIIKPIYRSRTPVSTGQAKCVRLNTASFMRNQAIREDIKKAEEAKKTEKRLCQTVSASSQLSRIRLKNKLQSNDTLNPTESIKKKVQQKKKEQQERDAQYRDELAQIGRRLSNRALIIEQQEMLMEKQRFEKKYAERMNSILDRSKKILLNSVKDAKKTAESTLFCNEKLNDVRITTKSSSNSDDISDDMDSEFYSESAVSSSDKLSKISERTEE
uniref:SCAPER_N domain-containing protein n=1 Tax=Syphacia muris TaxID=451379 RepID=A0A158R619_9BILA